MSAPRFKEAMLFTNGREYMAVTRTDRPLTAAALTAIQRRAQQQSGSTWGQIEVYTEPGHRPGEYPLVFLFTAQGPAAAAPFLALVRTILGDAEVQMQWAQDPEDIKAALVMRHSLRSKS